MTLKIITNFVYPPIPDRSMDWHAYYDGYEEYGPYGHGATEQEAIDDLVNNYDSPVDVYPGERRKWNDQ